jgi:NitT/TauT family transport system ATP-binding protein
MSAATGGSHASLRGVTKVYPAVQNHPPVHALGPVDLDLRLGEFFSVVGPSGCGKSTLLDVLAGLTPVSAGTVAFEECAVVGEVPEGLGIVFQEDASYPGSPLGTPPSPACAAVSDQWCANALAAPVFMGLAGFSPGYRRSSPAHAPAPAIARTLVTHPLLLLDEPFGASIQGASAHGDELLRIWRETGATILLITHALDEAAMLSDRVGVMSARPGLLIEIVETRWPRDRDSTIVSRPEFGEVTGQLWARLRGESLKALELTGVGRGGTEIVR